MIFKRFEDIIGWQKAQLLAVDIYVTFKGLNDNSFRNQICRAVTSISNNIAEGFDRSSDADFVRFLYIATGSASETRSMLYLAEKLNYIDAKSSSILLEKCSEVSKVIYGLISSVKQKSELS